MFTWVISSPSDPSMPSLSIFTGFLLTEKLCWIQWGSLNEVISVTSRKFPIFMFTYWYVILTHFLTSPFSGCWGFFFVLFCYFSICFSKRYSWLQFQPPINSKLLTFLYNFLHVISVAVEIFTWWTSLDLSAVRGWHQMHIQTRSYTIHKGLFQPFVPRSYGEKDSIKSI